MDEILSSDQRELMKLLIQGYVRFGKYKNKDIHLETFFMLVFTEFNRIAERKISGRLVDMYDKILREFKDILKNEIGEHIEIRESALCDEPLKKGAWVTRRMISDAKGAELHLIKSMPPGDR